MTNDFKDLEKEKLAAELGIANQENGKRAAELGIANQEKAKHAAELAIVKKEKEILAAEQIIANQENEKLGAKQIIAKQQVRKLAAELVTAKRRLAKLAAELVISKQEVGKLAAELIIAKGEVRKLAAELVIAKQMKEKRAAALVIANLEKKKRAAELVIAKREKEKRAAELVIANLEKEKRAAALVIAKQEKEKRAAALVIAKQEKENRAAELVIAKQEKEKEKREIELLKSRFDLKDSLIGTVAAMSRAVEARDPYTAGHQSRVADIACAIAEEMGLNEDQVEGIQMGATIHDIGKIQTPAEILSKPTKLSALEYLLIQEHAAKGYEILKDIKFPWPVAEIAYQHHERIDGSGYPQGLKGEEICLEARIVAVADVVEAMSSHRPYRAALGIEVALDEVKANRGILYDPVAVDACLKAHEKKMFSV
jgi:putative nucleotidyltransferase with HDIG domain